MKTLAPRRGGRSASRGSALLFALICVTLVAGVSYSLLRVTTFVSQRQNAAVDDKRAFYLAEAGLAEAYHGLSRGFTGQIGSPESPARVGDGLCWVEAIVSAEDDAVTLRSTALCGTGLRTLEIVVELEEQNLGIFADEGITLDVPFLVDGFDSTVASYEEQTGSGVLRLDKNHSAHDYAAQKILWHEGVFYDYYDFSKEKDGGKSFYYTATFPGEDTNKALRLAQAYFEGASLGSLTGADATSPDGTAQVPASALGPTTHAGGVLSSNGPIHLSSPGLPAEIHGDVLSGPEQGIVLDNVTVGGATGELTETVELDPVQLPSTELLPGFVQDSVVPRILPPGDLGYEYVVVRPGSELLLMGPGSTVFGDLELAADGALTIDNSGGAVDLFVGGRTTFAPGSRVSSTSLDPSDLTLHAASYFEPVELHATSQFRGGVYAPETHVSIGAGFELYGFLVANSLGLEAGSRLHFDTSLRSLLLPRLVGWKLIELPPVARSEILANSKQRVAVEPVPISEALVTESWQAAFDVFELDPSTGKKYVALEWNGPIGNFVPPASYYFISFKSATLVAPSAGSALWQAVVRGLDLNGSPLDYTGPVSLMPDMAISSLDEFRFWTE